MENNTRDPLVVWLFGFFGAAAAFLMLPKTLKYLIRRFVFGLVGEVVAVIMTGLLTEKAVDLLGNHQEQPAPAAPKRPASRRKNASS